MTDMTVTREPATYEPGAPVSFFKDLAAADRGDRNATQRLERHAREMEVRQAGVGATAGRKLRAHGIDLRVNEQRVNPNRTPGQGGSFAPPDWVIDEYADVPRAPRVLAALATRVELPDGVSSVNVPRLTVAGSVGPLVDLSAPSNTDLQDVKVTSPVVLLAGQTNVALQLLEQSPPGAHLDTMIWRMLSDAYDEQLETQLLYGTGTGGQLLGVTNVSGITQNAYTTATPAPGEMYAAWGQLVGNVADARRLARRRCWSGPRGGRGLVCNPTVPAGRLFRRARRRSRRARAACGRAGRCAASPLTGMRASRPTSARALTRMR